MEDALDELLVVHDRLIQGQKDRDPRILYDFVQKSLTLVIDHGGEPRGERTLRLPENSMGKKRRRKGASAPVKPLETEGKESKEEEPVTTLVVRDAQQAWNQERLASVLRNTQYGLGLWEWLEPRDLWNAMTVNSGLVHRIRIASGNLQLVTRSFAPQLSEVQDTIVLAFHILYDFLVRTIVNEPFVDINGTPLSLRSGRQALYLSTLECPEALKPLLAQGVVCDHDIWYLPGTPTAREAFTMLFPYSINPNLVTADGSVGDPSKRGQRRRPPLPLRRLVNVFSCFSPIKRWEGSQRCPRLAVKREIVDEEETAMNIWLVRVLAYMKPKVEDEAAACRAAWSRENLETFVRARMTELVELTQHHALFPPLVQDGVVQRMQTMSTWLEPIEPKGERFEGIRRYLTAFYCIGLFTNVQPSPLHDTLDWMLHVEMALVLANHPEFHNYKSLENLVVCLQQPLLGHLLSYWLKEGDPEEKNVSGASLGTETPMSDVPGPTPLVGTLTRTPMSSLVSKRKGISLLEWVRASNARQPRVTTCEGDVGNALHSNLRQWDVPFAYAWFDYEAFRDIRFHHGWRGMLLAATTDDQGCVEAMRKYKTDDKGPLPLVWWFRDPFPVRASSITPYNVLVMDHLTRLGWTREQLAAFPFYRNLLEECVESKALATLRQPGRLGSRRVTHRVVNKQGPREPDVLFAEPLDLSTAHFGYDDFFGRPENLRKLTWTEAYWRLDPTLPPDVRPLFEKALSHEPLFYNNFGNDCVPFLAAVQRDLLLRTREGPLDHALREEHKATLAPWIHEGFISSWDQLFTLPIWTQRHSLRTFWAFWPFEMVRWSLGLGQATRSDYVAVHARFTDAMRAVQGHWTNDKPGQFMFCFLRALTRLTFQYEAAEKKQGRPTPPSLGILRRVAQAMGWDESVSSPEPLELPRPELWSHVPRLWSIVFTDMDKFRHLHDLVLGTNANLWSHALVDTLTYHRQDDASTEWDVMERLMVGDFRDANPSFFFVQAFQSLYFSDPSTRQSFWGRGGYVTHSTYVRGVDGDERTDLYRLAVAKRREKKDDPEEMLVIRTTPVDWTLEDYQTLPWLQGTQKHVPVFVRLGVVRRDVKHGGMSRAFAVRQGTSLV
jgi:hypothetical protein